MSTLRELYIESIIITEQVLMSFFEGAISMLDVMFDYEFQEHPFYCEICKSSMINCFFSLLNRFYKTSVNSCFFKYILLYMVAFLLYSLNFKELLRAAAFLDKF